MNLDFYRNYVQIVECGTLSAAARVLHVAQSALSSQVKLFEEEYRTPLFVRNVRKMVPTDAGRILYDKAKRIVLLDDAAHKEIDACIEGSQGIVRIGMTQAYPDADMTQLLLKFQKNDPYIHYEFYEINSQDIIEMLRSGLIEIGVIRSAEQIPPDLAEHIRLRQRLCAYCCYNNPWISPYGKEVFLSSLDRVPLAISRGFQDTLRDIFDRADTHPVIMSISTSRSNPMMWARAGVAIAIICAGETETPDDAASFCRPLAADDPEIARNLITTRSFVTAKNRALSAAARKFLSFSQSYFQH